MQYEGRHIKRFARTGLLEDLEPPPSLSEVFHENTKLTPISARAYGMELGRVNASPLIKTLISAPYKVYSLGPEVPLDPVAPASPLEQVIARRRSVRHYSGEALCIEEVSRLLYFGYGITDAQQRFRAVASGGALYPLEIYILPLRIDGMEAGVYHYNVEDHGLDLVRRGLDRERLEACVNFREIDLSGAALVLVVTAIFQRTTIKYQDRGYRLLLIEAGAVGQNLGLTATSLGLASCMVGGFLDDELSRLLEVDGQHEAPLLPMVFGRSGSEAEASR